MKMLDLIIRNAKLTQKSELVDIAIKNGKFRSIKPNVDLESKKTIDARGHLVIPPFIESHVHLDSALTAGNPHFNKSGTLLEGIDIWSEYKEAATREDIKQSARKTIHWLIANGVLKIRTHTDTTIDSLITIEAMVELREEFKDEVDIQIVAFPQDGIFAYPDMDELLVEAIKMGADVIGGMPQAEFTREDGIRSIEYIFDLAEKYGKLIDIHTDETGDEHSRFLEVIAKHTLERNMSGRVTASHTTAMHNYNNDYVAKLIGLIKRAGIHIVTNPFSNTLLQNRLDGYPRKRGHTRIDELLKQNINVSVGNDNIMDPFNPLGKGSLLQALHLLVHTAHLNGEEEIDELLDLITYNGAKTLHIQDDYGIEENKQADCLILNATSVKDAIRLTSECLYVIRKGNIISETTPPHHKLFIQDDEKTIDFN